MAAPGKKYFGRIINDEAANVFFSGADREPLFAENEAKLV
jgi:hypothetical protein